MVEEQCDSGDHNFEGQRVFVVYEYKDDMCGKLSSFLPLTEKRPESLPIFLRTPAHLDLRVSPSIHLYSN